MAHYALRAHSLFVPLLQKAVELQPDDADVQLKLGQILFMQRDAQQGREAALCSLEKKPGRGTRI